MLHLTNAALIALAVAGPLSTPLSLELADRFRTAIEEITELENEVKRLEAPAPA